MSTIAEHNKKIMIKIEVIAKGKRRRKQHRYMPRDRTMIDLCKEQPGDPSRCHG